ncbi:hypothetical protein LGN13_23600 [Burkholderia multivorans]|uniref:hypothetical protein n=1 Tax=Burkholderia multivorans TaxID=87883 RepID=UPI001120E16A|nr:hypothetical protein [Burkholderia multivorans]MCA8504686.1 hypothetical protein [Burkholderia multivorans]MDN8083276.1 hypothetical protein [Burkholderia multivorans]
MIYHYCDATAFLSIIQEKKLWLSNTRKMNDHSEGFVIERSLLGRIQEAHAADDGIVADSALDRVKQALATARPELYACCFSRERDSTSQWLNYADRARGFAIGFDPNCLWINRIVPWNHSVLGAEKYVVPVEFSNNPEERLSLTPVLYLDRNAADNLVATSLWAQTLTFLDGGDRRVW